MPRDFEGRVIYEWNYLICCECDNDRGWKVATTSYRLYSEATIESFWKGSAAALINIATLKLEDASRQREYANGIAMSMLLSIKTWELDRPGQWDIEIDEDPGVSAAEVSAAAVRRPTRSTRRPARYI